MNKNTKDSKTHTNKKHQIVYKYINTKMHTNTKNIKYNKQENTYKYGNIRMHANTSKQQNAQK